MSAHEIVALYAIDSIWRLRCDCGWSNAALSETDAVDRHTAHRLARARVLLDVPANKDTDG